MKATDINKFKGDFKTAIQEWVEYRIDELSLISRKQRCC